ncbi:MAG TPA: hypothetical protein VMY78_04490 [Solirubrobacteraceae bacterium]|nr:hypothetical protein [Solirubrobacteraceae bacterium]
MAADGATSRAQRLRASYGALDRDQRFAAAAAVGLLFAMFLPWYEKSVVIPGSRSFAKDSISAFGAVSFVEAAIFLVSAGVVALLLARADQRPFHLPGGDGTVIFAAGVWATLLIFYRVFDRPDISGDGGTVGIQWGFFIAFIAAGALAVAGQRMRAAGRPEPGERRPQPATSTEVVPVSDAPTDIVPASEARTDVVRSDTTRRSRAVTRADAEQLTFDDPADDDDDPPLRPGEIPRARDQR